MAGVAATVSMKPGSIRGGAIGYTRNTANPIRFLTTTARRVSRYRYGVAIRNAPRAPKMTTKWGVVVVVDDDPGDKLVGIGWHGLGAAGW
jgi:hypothetical protein